MRILELSQTPAAAYAGLLMGQLGARVTRLDPGVADLDPATHRFVHRHKHTVSVDLATDTGIAAVLALARDADGLVDDLGPGGLASHKLSMRRLRRSNPNLAVVSISPFGQSGPHATWEASELVVQAMGGIVQSTGWDGEPPFKLLGPMAAFVAGLHAATAMFAAVYGVGADRQRTAHIDISEQETFLQHWSRHIGQWSYSGAEQRRDRRSLDGQGVPSMARASDGWICLAVRNARWNTVASLLGLDQFTGDEWQSARTRAERWSEIAPHFESSMAARTRDEWFRAAAERGLIFGPVQDVLEVLHSTQYAEREYFEHVDIDGTPVSSPGLPFTWEV